METTKLKKFAQFAHRSLIEQIPGRSIKVTFNNAWLVDEPDVERYLPAMREAFVSEIHKGTRIQI